MTFRELVQRVQQYSGFSDSESKDTLQMFVEVLSVHLTEAERRDFANQLPEELQNIALAVLATEQNSKQDILQQVMELQHVSRTRARKQIQTAWLALKEVISGGEIQEIKAHLPKKYNAILI